jgi:hypothetical protein
MRSIVTLRAKNKIQELFSPNGPWFSPPRPGSPIATPRPGSRAEQRRRTEEAQIAQAIPAADADLRAAIISAITLGITVSRHLISEYRRFRGSAS